MPKSNIKKVSTYLETIVHKSHNHFKGVDVSYELLKYSKSLLNDWKNHNRRSNYIPYARGTIVYVDFGLNIGAELSGPHYAIILNKTDNTASSKVTVAPLTSKTGKYNIELPIGISRLLGLWFAQSGLAHQADFPTKEEAMDMIFRTILEQNSGKTSPAEIAFRHQLQEYKNDNEFILSNLHKHIEKLKSASYFKIDNIVTISKFRIRKPRNKFDPLGKIIIPDLDMDIIDKRIAKHIIDN
ncbi:type II toxin-antitoxin system PemK/MazF family toxin [Lactiplantibacillus plantarum]|uniref:type II toxin-antitoxin system PemK/MazF family toxin n=1 Tax=Lactiplantibacillus plantarum TaxID=1590 RepID=UPI0015F9378F|nr:type II toxin-antitoxin system PemK/MazF family toxin [Lactiplantibacillus plantarum]